MGVRDRDDFAQWKKGVEAKLDKLFTLAASRPSLNVVQGGGFKVLDDDGNLIVFIGKLVNPDDPSVDVGSGMIITRPDGSDLLIASRLDADGAMTYSVINADGSEAFGLDTASGKGISNPWIGYPAPQSIQPSFWPGNTSGTYTEIARSLIHITHPYIYLSGFVYADGASCTGRMEVQVNGVVVGQAVESVNQAIVTFDQVVAVPDGVTIGETVGLSPFTRRTAGSGTIRGVIHTAIGRQSP